MYEAFSEILQQVNARVWQIEVTDWVDQFHYLRYKKGGHFKWHMDKGDGWRRVERKLSFTLMLSARDEYEGGDFQFFDGEPQTIKKLGPGDMVVFPGYVQHQVTRVTKGVRRSLVAWASGPKFK
jgi:PKHD-type hydroxylase